MTIGLLPAKETGNAHQNDDHDEVVDGPLAAGNVAVVLLVGSGVESQQFVDAGFASPDHVAALCEHAQQ